MSAASMEEAMAAWWADRADRAWGSRGSEVLLTSLRSTSLEAPSSAARPSADQRRGMARATLICASENCRTWLG